MFGTASLPSPFKKPCVPRRILLWRQHIILIGFKFLPCSFTLHFVNRKLWSLVFWKRSYITAFVHTCPKLLHSNVYIKLWAHNQKPTFYNPTSLDKHIGLCPSLTLRHCGWVVDKPQPDKPLFLNSPNSKPVEGTYTLTVTSPPSSLHSAMLMLQSPDTK